MIPSWGMYIDVETGKAYKNGTPLDMKSQREYDQEIELQTGTTYDPQKNPTWGTDRSP